MESILVEKKWEDAIKKGVSKDFFLHSSHEDWELRQKFRTGVSWHIPSESLVELIKEHSPVVSVGSGFAYTESLVLERGGDVIATDINPDRDNKWCSDGEYMMNVEKKNSVEAIQSYPERNVFMAWPPYDKPMAFETAKAMEVGRILIYVGEGSGGCTGDGDFFEYLYSNFEHIETEAVIHRWSGIYDNVYVYRKVKD